MDETVLEDLWRRIDAARWPDEPPDARPEHGIGLADARELARYWRESYDSRAAEATLNGFESAVVEGVHHLADGDGPPLPAAARLAVELWEFTRIMPLLRSHARVIVPSLPGYKYSFRPGDRRYSIVDCADRIHALMAPWATSATSWRAATGAPASCRLAHAYPRPSRRCTCT